MSHISVNMKSILAVSLFGFALLFTAGCEKAKIELPAPFMESYADVEECLSFIPFKGSQPDPGQSCVLYEYDGDSILKIKHNNAAFNCCPEEILTSFELRNDTIFIKEDDAKDLCRCNCLYNVEFVIHNLPPGKYILKFEEPLVPPGEEELIIEIDLKDYQKNQICLDRDYYPWFGQ